MERTEHRQHDCCPNIPCTGWKNKCYKIFLRICRVGESKILPINKHILMVHTFDTLDTNK